MTTTAKTSRLMSADITGTVLTIRVANLGDVAIDAQFLSDDIRTAAMMHGLKQKIADAAAMERNPDTGASATPDDKYRAMVAVRDRLIAGEWNKRAGGDGDVRGGYLLRALVQLSGRSVDDMRAFLAGKSKSECHALRESAKVKPLIDAMKAAEARDGAEHDADAMLADIGL